MRIDVLKCPECGAPLPKEALRGAWVCAFCKHTLTLGPGAVWALDPGEEIEPPEVLRRPKVNLDGRAYRLLGRMARGEHSDVFLARRAARITEMVVLKVGREDAAAGSLEAAARLGREWKALEDLHASDAKGAYYFQALLPQPVARGTLRDAEGREREASAFRFRSGFFHTLADVTAAYPAGVDPRAAVWIWKRTLELLGWVHRSGRVHGAVLPEHLLVHPRDHGIVLCGWSSSARIGEVRGGEGARPAEDIAMSARCVQRALGGGGAGSERLPASVPSGLAGLVLEHALGRGPGAEDAWALKEIVTRAARDAFGPPKYHPLPMPGWR